MPDKEVEVREFFESGAGVDCPLRHAALYLESERVGVCVAEGEGDHAEDKLGASIQWSGHLLCARLSGGETGRGVDGRPY